MQERRAEAAALAQEAVAVHTVVKDMGTLVTAQGESLTKVEATVDVTHDSMVAANRDVLDAARYQSSYRRKCCLLWVLILVAIAIVVIPVLLHVLPTK